jgi:hypothetical protein
MTLALVGIGFAFLVVMVLLSRMGRSRKQQAMADLEREREAVRVPDILELVLQEVQDLGLDRIQGSEGIDPSVLLQVYRRDVQNCDDGADHQFVVADGVDPQNADTDTVSLRCED